MKKSMAKWMLVLLFACAMSPMASVRAQGNDPRTVVVNFYTWYIKNIEHGWKLLGQRKADFDPSLLALIQKGYASSSIDFDPFVNAQMFGTGFTVGATKITGDKAAVPVHVKLERAGASDVVVSLKKSGAQWQIDNIVYPNEKFELRGFLTKNVH